jgi:hypothetical protein
MLGSGVDDAMSKDGLLLSDKKLCVDFLQLHKLLELPFDMRIKRVAMEPATRLTKAPGETVVSKCIRTPCEALAVYYGRIDDEQENRTAGCDTDND